jgi:hypothetical protein
MCTVGNHYLGACGEFVQKYSGLDAKEWPGAIGFFSHTLDSGLSEFSTAGMVIL